MPKMTPAKIWGCRFMGKLGRYYAYWPNGYERCPLGGVLKFAKFPTRDRVRKIFVNVIGYRGLIQ